MTFKRHPLQGDAHAVPRLAVAALLMVQVGCAPPASPSPVVASPPPSACKLPAPGNVRHDPPRVVSRTAAAMALPGYKLLSAAELGVAFEVPADWQPDPTATGPGSFLSLRNPGGSAQLKLMRNPTAAPGCDDFVLATATQATPVWERPVQLGWANGMEYQLVFSCPTASGCGIIGYFRHVVLRLADGTILWIETGAEQDTALQHLLETMRAE